MYQLSNQSFVHQNPFVAIADLIHVTSPLPNMCIILNNIVADVQNKKSLRTKTPLNIILPYLVSEKIRKYNSNHQEKAFS